MAIRKFDNRHSPVFRWDCESLFESSGNGLNLTASSAVFRQVHGNAVGLSPSVVVNRNGVSDASLRDYDDLTVQVLLVLRAAPSSTYVIAFQASGEPEPTNYSWSIQLTNHNQLTYFAECGAGLDTSYVASVPGRGLPAVGVPFNLTLRRRAVTGGVVVQFLVNGVPFGAPSGVLTSPTGGTTAQLVLNQTSSGVYDLLGVEIDNAALTDVQLVDAYNRTLGEELGFLSPAAQSLWVGALTDSSVTVVAQLTCAADDVRLAADDGTTITYSSAVSLVHGEAARFVLTGLSPDAEHTYHLECDEEEVDGPSGRFRTLPAGNASFKVAFAGDAVTSSNAAVFSTIRSADPLLFLHLGDAHYHNYTTNDQLQFHTAFNEILAQPRQALLYREVPTVYVWDDHDFGNNNCDSSSPTKPAAAAVYRLRVPHYPLPDATSVYQTFDVGRVRFIVTDQRSAANTGSATDNASKTMLGSAQKAWFKDLLSNSAGKLIVWVCPRWFGQPKTSGSDSWGGFSTERAELVSHIHANCPGRVVVVSADLHALGIDDGTNHDFLVGGGEPLRCFQAAPLDIAAPAAIGTYSQGSFAGSNQFGTMEVEDSGGSSIDVTWRGFDGNGAQLAALAFTVAL
jgi:hypothetical protein